MKTLPDEAGSFTYGPFDDGDIFTLNDPLVEQGSSTILDKSDATTGELATFTSPIVGTGSTLTLTFNAMSDGGSEAFGFDNISIQGNASTPAVPFEFEISTVAVLLGFFGLRRLRQRA